MAPRLQPLYACIGAGVPWTEDPDDWRHRRRRIADALTGRGLGQHVETVGLWLGRAEGCVVVRLAWDAQLDVVLAVAREHAQDCVLVVDSADGWRARTVDTIPGHPDADQGRLRNTGLRILPNAAQGGTWIPATCSWWVAG